MTPEIILVLGIAIGMIILFVLDLLPIDVIGLLIIVVLITTGLVSPEEGISGFSNTAVITIMALMIVGAALEETGTVQIIGYRLKDLFFFKEWQSIGLLMLLAGIISAFVNTTAVVIVFLSILLKISDQIPTNLSKLLIPLSFAGILGGACSLMGTSTNLLVSAISKDYGYAPFGFFEFTPIGVGIFLVALIYMLVFGRHFLPERVKKSPATEDYLKKTYITTLVINENSALVGKLLKQTIFFEEEEISLVSLESADGRKRLPSWRTQLNAGDILTVSTHVAKIKQLLDKEKVSFLSELSVENTFVLPKNIVLCEALLKPGSELAGVPLSKTEFWQRYGAVPIGVHRISRTADMVDKYISKSLNLRKPVKKESLNVGDSILILVNKNEIETLSNTSDFVVLREFHELNYKKGKIISTLLVLAGVVAFAALGILPIMVSALAGALLLVLLGCIKLHNAFRQINWSILFMLASMIPLGVAMHNTGADRFLAEQFVTVLPSREPIIVIGALFLFTSLLSSILSNNATAILLAPIAISLAVNLGLPPKPLLFSVMFAANTSYFTPIGYQTNTLIYNPGQYKFRDFFVVGGILTVLVTVVATFLIYWFSF